MSDTTNEIKRQKFNAWIVFLRQFKNPLLLVFIIATIVSYSLGQNTEATVIWIVMAISVILGFWNEYQAENIVNDLINRISFTAIIIRDGLTRVVPVREIVVNDEVKLHAGTIIPADMRLISSENLEVDESVLTGESLPVEKKPGDAVYMGTVVTGGSAHGEVVAIGMDTKYGKISALVGKTRPETEFQKGLRDFSSLLAKIAGVAVVLIIVLGWFLHHPIIETVLFALTVAMGITPELLPLIVTISLSYGAKRLAKKELIAKQFVAIEDLGNMEVLCTDKTGTLTEGKISLSTFTNDETLRLALICNSGFIHGHAFSDSIDHAIIDYAASKKFDIGAKPQIISSIPFNFESRLMTVVVKDQDRKISIDKGSPEAIISKCKLTASEEKRLNREVIDMQKDGQRVIAISKDSKMVGFLAFSDVPKKDLTESFKKFETLGVSVKIITGDSEIVAEKISRDAGFEYKKVLTGPEVEKLNEEELASKVWETQIFARVTPSQKTRIIESLKKGGHSVGYMGDGINDGPALRTADVGISVNTGVDVAKDAASVVIMRKHLGVIADGIREGRITFANTIKYILMGTSGDFSNMVSAAAASVFLPFLPMTPVQLLLTDILYDVSQVSIPTDNVDSDLILKPRSWDLEYIKRFILFFGSIGTVLDFLTFGAMYFLFHARGSLFQTGWFVTSFVTEVLVVFVIRTRKTPFWKSLPSLPFFLACLAVVAIGLWLPFSPLAKFFEFSTLPGLYFGFLIGITLIYLVFVEIGKYYLNHATSRTKS